MPHERLDFWALPKGKVTFVTQEPLDEPTRRRIQFLHGPPRDHLGQPLPADLVEERIREGFSLEFSPWPPADTWHADDPIVNNPGHFPVYVVHEVRSHTATDEEGTFSVTYDVFRNARFPYTSVAPKMTSDIRIHLGHWEEANRLIECAQALARVLRPAFAFGGEDAYYRERGLVDPRARAWPVTYYGPDLVKALGSDRILSAPAWRKFEDPETGGVWLILTPYPFVVTAKVEAVREQVEKHLKLGEAIQTLEEDTA